MIETQGATAPLENKMVVFKLTYPSRWYGDTLVYFAKYEDAAKYAEFKNLDPAKCIKLIPVITTDITTEATA